MSNSRVIKSLELIEKMDIREIKIEDRNYPESLKKIKQPPKKLYVRGSLPEGNFFAMVGTRRCSNYGKQIALEMAGELSQAGLIIVSGMAKGIDTFAHKGCLETGGKTIAVLGTGLDEKSIYPQENLKLAREIIKKGGCLLSEFEPGTPGYQSNFPARNRIISGLSLAVLVIEAKMGSGALITAKWAKEQNRKVFAVPGPINALNSKGPNLLIKQGAILVENANDILQELHLACLTSEVKHIRGTSAEESLVLQVLKEQPLHIEKIIEKTYLKPQKILSILAIMEIKGLVRNLGGNIFALKR